MFKIICKLSLVTAEMFEVQGFYFGFTRYNMPVVKVLVVQIQRKKYHPLLFRNSSA